MAFWDRAQHLASLAFEKAIAISALRIGGRDDRPVRDPHQSIERISMSIERISVTNLRCASMPSCRARLSWLGQAHGCPVQQKRL
jgi:hypothetical protein